MNRRRCLMVLAATLVGAPSIVKGQPSGSTDYEGWLRLFQLLLSATDPIADDVTAQKFGALLRKIGMVLQSIADTKATVSAWLRGTDCHATATTSATELIVQLQAELESLKRLSGELAGAVKPPKAVSEAARLSGSYQEIMTTKMWYGDAGQYCQLSAQKRQELLGDIEKSAQSVRDCTNVLTKLQARYP
jgi:hypothetical protein